MRRPRGSLPFHGKHGPWHASGGRNRRRRQDSDRRDCLGDLRGILHWNLLEKTGREPHAPMKRSDSGAARAWLHPARSRWGSCVDTTLASTAGAWKPALSSEGTAVTNISERWLARLAAALFSAVSASLLSIPVWWVGAMMGGAIPLLIVGCALAGALGGLMGTGISRALLTTGAGCSAVCLVSRRGSRHGDGRQSRLYVLRAFMVQGPFQ